MPIIFWNDSYSVKVKEIDNQHIKLIDIINELHDKMKEGKGREILEKVLNGLVEYTIFHFSYEEEIFIRHNYPEFRTHASKHVELINQVKNYVKKFESGNSVSTVDLMNFLKDWLLTHIMETDKKYSTFLNAKGIC